jgi:hypothetical protein
MVIASVACSSSSGSVAPAYGAPLYGAPGIPTIDIPGIGVVEPGVTKCGQKIYYPDGQDFVVCEDGVWQFTTETSAVLQSMGFTEWDGKAPKDGGGG